jgi:hypothetical protein
MIAIRQFVPAVDALTWKRVEISILVRENILAMRLIRQPREIVRPGQSLIGQPGCPSRLYESIHRALLIPPILSVRNHEKFPPIAPKVFLFGNFPR